jgi:CheY-like chemotaxis protein
MAATNPPISPQKTALVVDDSKLARYVLKEMLLDFGLQVETAESAEEALGSLSAFRPDVIFMDHMMPGMDGFQAVEAIKSDPKTATIPILMYTSKDEGVYVNQARALGAVGVLPKKLKPVQLEKVLLQLRLVLPKEPKLSTAVHAIKETATVSTQKSQHSLEELARSASEEQEKDSMRLLFRQLFSEQRSSIKQDQWQLVGAMVEQVTPIVLATRNKIARWQIVALSGVFLLLMCIFVLVYELISDGSLQQQKLNYQINEQRNMLLRLEESLQSAQLDQQNYADDLSRELNVKPIEWAINHNAQLSFYQSLNSISTQSYVIQLINQLDDFGFIGSLYIQFHSGRFCQQNVDAEQPLLVRSEESLSQCQFDLVSINSPSVIADFENFLVGIGQEFPHIKVDFESVGTQFTLQDYPDVSDKITAGQWNQIAMTNNRFNFVLVNEH